MPPSALTLDDLRRFAVSRSFFAPTTLARAIDRIGFVQADPIRAPARAQDLILRHRVKAYRAGDLERRYASLDVHEDFFVNYGFLNGANWALMHPRSATAPWDAATMRRARAVLAFVRERGRVHPRDVEERFAHGNVVNDWGGSSTATTRLLDGLHYRGKLRVVARERGIRVYAPHEHARRPRHAAARRTQLDGLVALLVQTYAPLPSSTLATLVRRLRRAVPQHHGALGESLARARERLGHTRIDGLDWYWPADERPRGSSQVPAATVRLLAPFDPVVWDRGRFETFWGWAYRFEAYTPDAKRKLGHYALPLLWDDRVVGWGNLAVADGRLSARFGYVAGKAPRGRGFADALDAELARMEAFLRL